MSKETKEVKEEVKQETVKFEVHPSIVFNSIGLLKRLTVTGSQDAALLADLAMVLQHPTNPEVYNTFMVEAQKKFEESQKKAVEETKVEAEVDVITESKEA